MNNKYIMITDTQSAEIIGKVAFDKYQATQKAIDPELVEDEKVYGRAAGKLVKDNPTTSWYAIHSLDNGKCYMLVNGMLHDEVKDEEWLKEHNVEEILTHEQMIERGFIVEPQY